MCANDFPAVIWDSLKESGHGSGKEKVSLVKIGTAITASLDSHRYLDSRWPRLMCGPISDSHSYTRLNTAPCQQRRGCGTAPSIPLFFLLGGMSFVFFMLGQMLSSFLSM